MVDLSIIIPSFNTKDLLVKCLKSLQQCNNVTMQQCNKEIIVVDNGSKDRTVEELKKVEKTRFFAKSLLFHFVQNKENSGFAKAINQGLKIAQGKYILLLNSDTIVEKGTIEKMVQYLELHPQVGVVGCQLRNSDGSIQDSGGYLPNLLNVFFWMFFIDDLLIVKNIFHAFHITDKNFYVKEQRLGWVTGAFFMTKKEILNKVGLFDEKIFMYMEEVDWCQRVRNAGYEVIFNPSGRITHEKGGSDQNGKAGIIEEFQGLKYFFQKHKPLWQYLILRILLKIGALARIFLFAIILQDKKAGQIYEKAFKLV